MQRLNLLNQRNTKASPSFFEGQWKLSSSWKSIGKSERRGRKREENRGSIWRRRRKFPVRSTTSNNGTTRSVRSANFIERKLLDAESTPQSRSETFGWPCLTSRRRTVTLTLLRPHFHAIGLPHRSCSLVHNHLDAPRRLGNIPLRFQPTLFNNDRIGIFEINNEIVL